MSVTIGCTLQHAIERSKQSTRDRIASVKSAGKRELATIRKNARVLTRLMLVLPTEAELALDSTWNYESPFVTFPRESLTVIRKAIGRLHVAHKTLQDAEQGIVTVHLTAEQYPGIEFRYDRPLSSGCQCRIVEQTNTYKTLVCSID